MADEADETEITSPELLAILREAKVFLVVRVTCAFGVLAAACFGLPWIVCMSLLALIYVWGKLHYASCRQRIYEWASRPDEGSQLIEKPARLVKIARFVEGRDNADQN